jgi:hypothetical protein
MSDVQQLNRIRFTTALPYDCQDVDWEPADNPPTPPHILPTNASSRLERVNPQPRQSKAKKQGFHPRRKHQGMTRAQRRKLNRRKTDESNVAKVARI